MEESISTFHGRGGRKRSFKYPHWCERKIKSSYECNIEVLMDVNTPPIFDKYPDENCELIKDEHIVEDEHQVILIQGDPITHNP